MGVDKLDKFSSINLLLRLSNEGKTMFTVYQQE